MDDNEARWVEEDDGSYYYYYSDGTMATGWMQCGDYWYYFDESGKMATGWRNIDGDTYYFYSTGEMATGWIDSGNGWYYLYDNGSIAWGRTVNGYLLDKNGKMVTGTGWVYEDGDRYYLKDDKIATGWLQDGDNWSYLYDNGTMAWGRTVDGYYLNDNGDWVKDKGWKTEKDNNGNVTYYYVDSEIAVTGWKEIDSKWYYFDEDGKMKTGWIEDNGNWYYLNSSGAMETGQNDIDGNTYYFYSTGEMATGWVQYGDKWHYFYKDDNGSMAHATWIDEYYVDDNGDWVPDMNNSSTQENTDDSSSQDTNNTYEEPRWNDKIISYIKGTQRFQWFIQETQEGELKSFFDLTGFDIDENGVYHAKQDAIIQSRAGYNDFYDDVFDLGCSMNKEKYEFSTSSEQYIIWIWKGDYLNLGAGAEIGIYKGGGPWWDCDIEDAMPMTLRVEDKKGNLIFDWKPTERNWWCTGFNPDCQNRQEQNLTVYGSIDFSKHLDMWDAFYDRWNGRSLWNFDQKPIAKFIWK